MMNEGLVAGAQKMQAIGFPPEILLIRPRDLTIHVRM